MALTTGRAGLVAAAFELFETVGYDGTTVDDIAARAGVGRTTFFRAFGGKNEVVFPDHAAIRSAMTARLSAAEPADPAARAREAALQVLRSFVAEGDLARSRYRLTSTVPALRDAEIASMSGYQRELYHFFAREYGDAVTPLQAELLAMTWVVTHNHVLRRWLKGLTETPERDLADALDAAFAQLREGPSSRTPSVVVFTTDKPLTAVLPRLRKALGEESHL